jgi:hypothetical protein
MGNSLNSQPIESSVDEIVKFDDVVEMSTTSPSLDIQNAEIIQLWENPTSGITSSKKSMRKNDGDFYQVRWVNLTFTNSGCKYLPLLVPLPLPLLFIIRREFSPLLCS